VLQECINDSLCAPSCSESASRTIDAHDAHVMSATFSGSARLFELSRGHAVGECTALGDTFKNDSTVDGQILTSEWYIPVRVPCLAMSIHSTRSAGRIVADHGLPWQVEVSKRHGRGVSGQPQPVSRPAV